MKQLPIFGLLLCVVALLFALPEGDAAYALAPLLLGALLPAPNEYLTLLDIARRTGSDQIQGLIEGTVIFAPELDEVPGNPMAGTLYQLRVRTSFPRAHFRNANEGVPTGKSTYDNRVVSMKILDAQMRADKAVAMADPRGAAMVLAEEAQGQTKGAMLTVGEQFYYGEEAGSKGFAGLQQQVDPTMVIDAEGNTAGAQTSVYAAYVAEDGVKFLFGNGGEITMPEQWREQQVQDENGLVLTAYVNGMTMWIGLLVPTTRVVGRIKNLEDTDGHRLSDRLIAQLIQRFPRGTKPNRLFMTPEAVYQLQVSRSQRMLEDGTLITDNNSPAYGMAPTESNGVRIVETDSIRNNEPVEA